MSQSEVLDFLKENEDTWFNVYLIVAGLLKKKNKPTTDFEAVEIQVRRAMVKLNWTNEVSRKVLRTRTYYKYNKYNLNI